MIPHWSQDDPLQGNCKLFKITSDCRNVIEFGAQEFPSLHKILGVMLFLYFHLDFFLSVW